MHSTKSVDCNDWCAHMESNLSKTLKKGEESESNGSGLNRSRIDRRSIGYQVKGFSEGVEDALAIFFIYTKPNFID